MLKSIKQFFEVHLLLDESPSQMSHDHSLRIASAALLVEMMYVDDEIKGVEKEKIIQLIQEEFGLTDDETNQLIAIAEDQAKQATDLYQFTQLMNQSYTHEQKLKVIEGLWRVALSDNVIDRYEEQLVRKVADLLHVPHGEYIAAKIRVLDGE
ncbi:MAG: TerB family tellurite resistance protein [Methylococcales bacterium]